MAKARERKTALIYEEIEMIHKIENIELFRTILKRKYFSSLNSVEFMFLCINSF